MYVVVAAGNSWRLPLGVTRPGSGSMVTPVGFSVYHTKVKDCPGLIEAGSAVKLTILACMSLALPYAEPSKPAGTAPGANFGGVWPAAGWAGAWPQTAEQMNAAIAAKLSIVFICKFPSRISYFGRRPISYKS